MILRINLFAGSQRQQLPKKPSGLGRSQFYGKASGGTADAHVREKVVEAMTAALDKVAQDKKPEGELPSTGIVAAAVEQALFDLYGMLREFTIFCNALYVIQDFSLPKF